jgi:hypothetical protein
MEEKLEKIEIKLDKNRRFTAYINRNKVKIDFASKNSIENFNNLTKENCIKLRELLERIEEKLT